jgi:uncharacterized protein YdaU (DUF1376 family)
MGRAWMPFYVGDYLRDTMHLSTVEHGAYCLLLFYYWNTGALPDDDRHLARIARMTLRQWRQHRPTLQTFFYDGWKHKRVESELSRAEIVRLKRISSGQKGGIIASINRFKKR